MSRVVFKQLSTADELDQLQRLNHSIFAEELRQHRIRLEATLPDPYHQHNRYFIAVDSGEVVGMISLNSHPPFSIQKRLPADLQIATIAPAPCEVRLLAVAPVARNGTILAGLLWQVLTEARHRGCSHMLISGAFDREPMYRALGFQALGPPVTEGEASFVPMLLDLCNPVLIQKAERFMRWWLRRSSGPENISLLPGPVQISATVKQAFAQDPQSHRDRNFILAFNEVRERLCLLAPGMDVAVITGSGTLANDVVAAGLRSAFGDAPGLVLANGEFGERLIDQARRAGLRAKTLRWNWGTPWNHAEIETELARGSRWVWCVHLETSTGQVNDLSRLGTTCRQHGAALAADCVSSLGAVRIPSTDLYLASGVSGKSLGSYAGLAFVFVSQRALREVRGEQLPATFDVVAAIHRRQPSFTVASPQLLALQAALEEHYRDSASIDARFAHYADLAQHLRSELERLGFKLIAQQTAAPPPIASFVLPDASCASRCRDAGFHIAHESAYLQHRSWGQIAIMGDLDRNILQPVLKHLCPPKQSKVPPLISS